MFKKSKRKIVASIMLILVLLLAGTLCTIYLASYSDMTEENRDLLDHYVEGYIYPKTKNGDGPDIQGDREERGDPRGKRPMLELSTFYSVVFSPEREVLAVDNGEVSAYSEEELTKLAEGILEEEKEKGKKGSLLYEKKDKGGYILVAFLDNTLMLESAGTLVTYTLIFGGIALVLIFLLANYMAGKILAPLEENYERQKQFVSDAGHELKTPAAVINANLELLTREIGENQWLSNIQYENQRMSALITQLLDLARAENASSQMEPLDLSHLVWGETLPFEPVAYEKGLALNSSIEEEIWVNGNSVQLKQLTSILIDNGIRHGSQGKEVNLELKRVKNSAVLSVANEGREIPEEQRKHLFERFYRSDQARAAEDGHYGLGLAIAKAIAQTHKGSIQVQCRDGMVIFLVKLPLQKGNTPKS